MLNSLTTGFRRAGTAALALCLLDCGHAANRPRELEVAATRAEKTPERGRLRWVAASLHAHAHSDLIHDDGHETPTELHRAVRAAGAAFSLHTVHSVFNAQAGAPAAQAAFDQLRAQESRLRVPGLTVATGEELTVAPGPHFVSHDTVFGYPVPGNLDHLTLLGVREFVPNGTSLEAACRRAHRAGGLCLVNHPGPGPTQWESGWWEQAGHRELIDGVEVYNGVGLSTLGFNYEARYLEASSPRGLGCQLAAVASPDTHGPEQVKQLRARVGGTLMGKLMRVLGPEVPVARPELLAQTLVLAEVPSEKAVVAAVKARRTVAVFGLGDLDLDVPGLGEVRPQREVELAFSAGRALTRITLYRNGRAIETWSNTAVARWSGTTDEAAAYVFGAQDGDYRRLMTSAIWYRPPAK